MKINVTKASSDELIVTGLARVTVTCQLFWRLAFLPGSAQLGLKYL